MFVHNFCYSIEKINESKQILEELETKLKNHMKMQEGLNDIGAWTYRLGIGWWYDIDKVLYMASDKLGSSGSSLSLSLSLTLSLIHVTRV
jgi:hypothetical protein